MDAIGGGDDGRWYVGDVVVGFYPLSADGFVAVYQVSVPAAAASADD